MENKKFINRIDVIVERIQKEYSANTLQIVCNEEYSKLSIDSKEAALFNVAFIEKDVEKTFTILKRWYPVLDDPLIQKMAGNPYNMLEQLRPVFLKTEYLDVVLDLFYIFSKDTMKRLAR